jgi:hypothetical protein
MSPDWGLMLTGVIAGSVGFFGGRFWDRGRDRRQGGGHG